MNQQQRQIIRNVALQHGVDSNVRNTMERLAELTVQLNRYYNNSPLSQRDAIESLSSTVANVEVGLISILGLMDENKYNHLIHTTSKTDRGIPTDMMGNCSKLVNSLNEYFFKNGKDLDVVIGDCVDVGLVCNHVRGSIGDEAIDRQLTFKVIAMESKSKSKTNNNR